MFKIQRRRVKCKKCGKEIYNTEAYLVVEGTRKLYYCTEDEYIEIQKEKDQCNNCLMLVAEIMNEKFVAPVMVKKLKEIRQFYDYYVISRTFKECEPTIKWSIENRDFNNEFAKTKYIVAIVANNIAKVDKKLKKEKRELEKLFNNNDIAEIDILDIPISTEVKDRDISDISMFLD